ncbi:MAG: hydroxyphenylacetyl-CoA thioesterase PaaI [Pseudomonadota bacterium]
MSPEETAKACAEHLWQSDATSQGLGITLDHVGPGTASLTMAVTPEMLNAQGTAHGGYLFTLADSAFAYACQSRNEASVAHHCAVTFIVPGALGDRLTATAREVSRHGRSSIFDVQICRQGGAVIAEFRGHSRSLGRSVLTGTAGSG